jgi:sigma-B regulation protein RsbU (phosphoserine phosphatase)
MASNAVMTETYSQWAAACEVQQRFMQHSTPAIDNLSYSAQCRQMCEVGGDCYEFIQLPHNQLALAIGDASGKGLPAALMISSVQSSLRTAALFTGSDAPAVLAALNRQVHASSLAGRYATLFYGVFDGRTRTLQYVNAGHNPPMIVRRDGSILWLETGGVPVGMFPNYAYVEGAIQLEPGDMVVGYTDGVIEALNPLGEEWGVDGLQKSVTETNAQTADDLVQAIFESMDKYSHGCQTDDATVVVLRVL